MASPEAQLDSFIAKFSATNQRLIRECRDALRQLLPAAHELVYDNYNFFVIGYCTGLRPSDCLVSIAASAKGASLSFYHGTDLADPAGVLLGAGSQNRFVRLESAATLARPDVVALIEQAVRIAKTPFAGEGAGTLVIRSISAKQRPRQ